jgi:hypothetical protein
MEALKVCRWKINAVPVFLGDGNFYECMQNFQDSFKELQEINEALDSVRKL